MGFKILGTGSYVPKNIVTNDDLSKFIDTSDEWIRERTGIKQRHICTTETAVDLGIAASKKALEQSGVKPTELDMILSTTTSGQYSSPSVACMIQQSIGATCPVMEINAACSAFIYMLDTADAFLSRKEINKILVVGAEQISRIVDWTDRSTCVIFGDGAGAAVLEKGDNYKACVLRTYGGNDVIKIPNYFGNSPFYENQLDKPYIHMKGQETFKFAVSSMQRDIIDAIEKAGLSQDDIDFVIPHQANQRIIDFVKRKLSIAEDKYICNIEQYGNTSSASVPIALDELNRSGRLKRGDIIAMAAFGGGLSSAACILEW